MSSEEANDERWAELHANLGAGMARGGIQRAMLLNGGAAVALLSFLGNNVGARGSDRLAVDLVMIKWAMLDFGVGVFLAAWTYFAAYMIHHASVENHLGRSVRFYRRVAIAMCLGSLMIFLAGIVITANAIAVR